MNRTAKIWLLLLTLTTLAMVVALVLAYRNHLARERESQRHDIFSEPGK